MLKQKSELKDGKCIAVCECGKEFKASYNSKLNVVFYTINSSYKVIGYRQ